MANTGYLAEAETVAESEAETEAATGTEAETETEAHAHRRAQDDVALMDVCAHTALFSVRFMTWHAKRQAPPRERESDTHTER